VALVITCLMIDVVFVHIIGSRGLLQHLVHDLIYIKINKMAAFFPLSLVHIVGLCGISLSLFYQTIRW
jgi:hypothetical protein